MTAIRRKSRLNQPNRLGCGAVIWVLAAIALGVQPALAEPHELTKLTRVRAKRYAQRDGVDLLADVYMPPGDGPFPALLMVHGGAWAVGSKWTMISHANEAAQHGFTAVAINYRLAPKHKFPAQLEDCRAALDWMRKNARDYKIDPNRIGAYGYSAGGHLVSLLAVTGAKPAAQPALTCVVAGGAPCSFDWLDDDNRSLSYFLGGSRLERPTTYRNASPLSFVSKNAPPFFLFHAENDKLVPTSSSRSFHDRLRMAGVNSTYHVVREKGHMLAFHDRLARDKAIEFLKRQLGPASQPRPRNPVPSTPESEATTQPTAPQP